MTPEELKAKMEAAKPKVDVDKESLQSDLKDDREPPVDNPETGKLAPVMESEPPTSKLVMPIKSEREKEVDSLRAEMQKIVDQYGGFGAVPMTSKYWEMRNRVQALESIKE